MKIGRRQIERKLLKQRRFLKLLSGLVALLLVACGEPSVTALPSTVIPGTTASANAPVEPTRPPSSTTNPTIGTSPLASTPATLPQATVAPTPAPSNPASPTPSSSPFPAFKPGQRQIGSAGCCQDFAFAGDGRLYFYDKDPRPSTYILDLNTNQRSLLTTRFGMFSRDLSLVAVSERATNVTTIEQVSDGSKRATLQNRASETLISPDKSKLAYLLRGLNQAAEEPQLFELWTGNSDGSKLKVVWNLREGANLAWFPDNRHLLLTARDAANKRFGLWVVDTEAAPGQAATLIVESKGLIAATLSSDGSKIVYALTLQGETNSGIWTANADGSNRHKFDWIGGWRWSPTNPDELFYIPARVAIEKGHNLWSYDAATGKATNLVNPATLSFQIALDEWEVAPDGKSVAYRNAADNAVWLLRFRP